MGEVSMTAINRHVVWAEFVPFCLMISPDRTKSASRDSCLKHCLHFFIRHVCGEQFFIEGITGSGIDISIFILAKVVLIYVTGVGLQHVTEYASINFRRVVLGDNSLDILFNSLQLDGRLLVQIHMHVLLAGTILPLLFDNNH